LEQPTLNQLSDYLTQSYAEQIKANILPEYSVKEKPMKDDVGLRAQIEGQKQQEELGPQKYRRDDRISSIGETKVSKVEKVAVIGIGCHFPGARDKETYWKNLAIGKTSIVEIPKSRWDMQRYYAPKYKKGKSISKWGGFIDEIEYFDPTYFNIREDVAHQIEDAGGVAHLLVPKCPHRRGRQRLQRCYRRHRARPHRPRGIRRGVRGGGHSPEAPGGHQGPAP